MINAAAHRVQTTATTRPPPSHHGVHLLAPPATHGRALRAASNALALQVQVVRAPRVGCRTSRTTLRTGPKRFVYSAAVGCFSVLLLLDFFIAAPPYVEVDCP